MYYFNIYVAIILQCTTGQSLHNTTYNNCYPVSGMGSGLEMVLRLLETLLMAQLLEWNVPVLISPALQSWLMSLED